LAGIIKRRIAKRPTLARMFKKGDMIYETPYCRRDRRGGPPPGRVPAATTNLRQAGATLQSFSADKLKCQAISQGMAGDQLAFGSLMFVAIAADANRRQKQGYFETCMQADGYTIVPTQYGVAR
jgi:hypothetical protein